MGRGQEPVANFHGLRQVHGPATAPDGARACATSHRRTATCRTGGRWPSPRPPARGSSALHRAGVAGLAVRVRVAFAVARLGVGAAAATHPDVAGLDRPRLLARRVVEVRLDGRRRAPEPVRDPSDREALGLAVMARQSDRPTTLENPIRDGGCHLARHARSRYLGNLVFSPRSASQRLPPDWTYFPRIGGAIEKRGTDPHSRSAGLIAARPALQIHGYSPPTATRTSDPSPPRDPVVAIGSAATRRAETRFLVRHGYDECGAVAQCVQL